MLNKTVFVLALINIAIAIVTYNFTAGCGWFVASLGYLQLSWK